MNVLDDHDTTDDALRGLGSRLRTDADRRPADLDRLGTRLHAERQRTRLALVAGCATVILVLGVAVGIRAGGDDESLRVGDGADEVTSSVAPAEPVWTVNPSIPADPANGEVWGVDVVYDAAVWDYERLTDQPALDMMRHVLSGGYPVGMAGFHREPRLQAYWQGPGARDVAEATRSELLALPGIVSVEVGRAEPTSRPPGTTPVFPATTPTSPTTLLPVVRPELPDPRPTQDEILADGIVTDEEHDVAFWTWVECAEAGGIEVTVLGRTEDGRIEGRVQVDEARTADACYQSLFLQVDRAWQLALDDPSGSATTTG